MPAKVRRSPWKDAKIEHPRWTGRAERKAQEVLITMFAGLVAGVIVCGIAYAYPAAGAIVLGLITIGKTNSWLAKTTHKGENKSQGQKQGQRQWQKQGQGRNQNRDRFQTNP